MRSHYLNPVRQVKTAARQNRGHGGQSSPQHAQHCHLIGLEASASLPHAPQFILHSCITVGDHPPKRCQAHELWRTHTGDRYLSMIVDSWSRQPLSTTLTLVDVKSPSLYVMAGKRRRSIVPVTFIRVLMFLSQLVWHSRHVNPGIDRPPNRGSGRAWRRVLSRIRTSECFNHSLLIRSSSSFSDVAPPTGGRTREAVNSAFEEELLRS